MFKHNKKGALSIEMIIAIIIAVVVLLTVILFFTGAFERATSPVGQTISVIECKGHCQAENKETFCKNNCPDLLSAVGDKCKKITC